MPWNVWAFFAAGDVFPVDNCRYRNPHKSPDDFAVLRFSVPFSGALSELSESNQ